MGLELGNYHELKGLEQSLLKRKYSGCLVDGNLPLHEYYQQLGSFGERVNIVESAAYRSRDRSTIETEAAERGMNLQLSERTGMDEIALVPMMVNRAPSLQRNLVESIMSQAMEALRRQ